MRKWLLLSLAGFLFAFPPLATAQTGLTLSKLDVQFWPEYDQPSMLVIYDFTVAPDTQLPISVKFHIPLEANLIATASTQNGQLVTIPVVGSSIDGEWQSFTINVEEKTAYHFEYYEPLTFNGDQRTFNYLWDGSYAVSEFSIRVLQPVDATSIVTEPVLKPNEGTDGNTYLESTSFSLPAGKQFQLSLQYQKSTKTLIRPTSDLQPSSPVDENTPGRIALTNYLPYFLGGLGILLIFGGFVYANKARRRRHASNAQDDSDSEVYCHQCGTRAKASDRFCRVCGSRLRQDS